MVNKAINQKNSPLRVISQDDIPEEELKYTSVKLSDVIKNSSRLEAAAFSIDGLRAKEVLQVCKWDLVPISGKNGLVSAYHRPRFKRVYLKKSDIHFSMKHFLKVKMYFLCILK